LTVFDIIHPDSLEHCKVMFNKLISGEPQTKIEAIFKTKNGSPIAVEGNVYLRNLGDKIIVTQGFFLDITDRKQTEEKLMQNYDTQNALNSLLHLSLENVSLDEIFNRTISLIFSIPWLVFESRGSIFLVEENPSVLLMKAQNNLAEPIKKMCNQVPFGRCLCGRAALTQEIQFADCLDDRHENIYNGISEHGHYCVPIVTAGKTSGVINIYVKQGHCQEKKEEEFLSAIADTLSGIILRKMTEKELQQSFDKLHHAMAGTIHALAAATEMRDPYTAGHQKRVANLARSIATEMNLSHDMIEGIRIAATIHDIGKIYVPAEILSKPTKLTSIEFDLIKTHPQGAYDILKDIEFPWPIAQIVLQHHERLNGSGYPQGLKSDQILQEAKIIAVADVVEAMATHRPYRPGLGIDAALDEIKKNSGIFYDPIVVTTCLLVFQKGFIFD
jgi:HD-GYP domain-containing protein (c-di-GMP phosphodiesterase class II)